MSCCGNKTGSGVVEATPATQSNCAPACPTISIPQTVCRAPNPCNCGSCARQPAGCCGPSSNVASAPFFVAGRVCAEDNRQTVVVRQLVGAFKNVAAFCMPACNASISVLFDSVGDVPINAWLWAFGIGYLEISGFNPVTGEIRLTNLCPQNTSCGQTQAAPGTPIPACTTFVLLAPFCSSQSGSSNITFPYLAVDFTAPAVSTCIEITVTNTNGLSVGKEINIKSGTYRISAILSSTLITICNDGQGLVAGTAVIAKDAAGNLIVPITLLDSDPCSNATVLAGKPLVCHGGLTQPIVGSENGQVLVYDSGSGEASFRTLGLPVLDCTTLTVCLTLDPALPPDTAYIVQVVSTAAFTPTEVVTINGTQFTVDSIIDATSMRVIPVSAPVVVENFPVNSVLCSADCCTIIANKINNFFAYANVNDAAEIGSPATINGGTPAKTGHEASITFVNTSTIYTMGVTFSINATWLYYHVSDADAKASELFRNLQYVADPNPLAPLAPTYELPSCHTFQTVPAPEVSTRNQHSFAATQTDYRGVPPGGSLTIRARTDAVWIAGDTGTSFLIVDLDTRITVLGVAFV